MTDKNILIAITDIDIFTKTLPDIIKWLKSLNGNLNATLLYIADATDMESAIPILEDISTKNKQLIKIAEELNRQNIPTKLQLRTGVPHREIITEAKRKGAFTILMSTDSRGIIPRAFSRNIVKKVMEQAPCPVVVFKPQLLRFTDKVACKESHSKKRVVVSTDTQEYKALIKEKKVIIVVNTALDTKNPLLPLDFAEFSAEWMTRHLKDLNAYKAILLYQADNINEIDNAKKLLGTLIPAFEKRGIKATVIVNLSEEQVTAEIDKLQPEIVFVTGSKLAKHIEKHVRCKSITYPNPKQKELKTSIEYGVIALILYTFILIDFGFIQELVTKKSLISVLVVLITVILVAYAYGNTITHTLRYLGIKPKAH